MHHGAYRMGAKCIEDDIVDFMAHAKDYSKKQIASQKKLNCKYSLFPFKAGAHFQLSEIEAGKQKASEKITGMLIPNSLWKNKKIVLEERDSTIEKEFVCAK